MLKGDLSDLPDHRKRRIQMVNKLNAGLSFIILQWKNKGTLTLVEDQFKFTEQSTSCSG